MMENNKCSNLAAIGPTPAEEWGTFGQKKQGGIVPICASLPLPRKLGLGPQSSLPPSQPQCPHPRTGRCGLACEVWMK